MLVKDFVFISDGFFNSNQQRPDQGKSFQNSDPFKIVNPNPSIIIARKKRSSFSCKIHESVCKYWCRIAGHSTGSCDIEVIFKKSLRLETSFNFVLNYKICQYFINHFLTQGECLCSEEDLEKYICDPNEEGPGNKTQHTLCAGWCQLKGKQSGKLKIFN